MKKKIFILGSTGSIGLATLSIVNKEKKLLPNIFSANKNYNLICKQIKKFKPKIFIINDEKTYTKIIRKFKRSKIKIFNNFDKINKTNNSDITVTAIPGIAGLQPTLKMIENSKKILIANKESIICGWELIKKSKENKTKIIPVDSEHFSILN